MSDTSQGDGWWIASDGKWYPPETHPDYAAPVAAAPQDPAVVSEADVGAVVDTPSSEPPAADVAPAAIVGPAQSAESWSDTTSTPPAKSDQSEESYSATLGPGMPVAGAGPRPIGQAATPTALRPAEPSFWQKPAMWAAAAVLAVLAVGAGFLLGGGGGGDKVDTNASSPNPTTSSVEATSTPRQAPTSEPQPTAETAVAPTEVPLEEPTSEPSPTEPPVVMGDISNCGIEDESVVLSLTNSGTELASYFVDLEYFDADGVAVGEDWAAVSYVRPGEVAIERSYLYTENDAIAVTCSVVAVDRSVDPDSDALAHAECIVGPDEYGELRADVTMQNQSGALSNYDVYVAVTDDEGVRIASGSAYVSLLEVDEIAKSDAYLGPASGLAGECQVVYVSVYEEASNVFADPGATDVSDCVVSEGGSVVTVSISSTGDGMRSYEPRVVYLDADGLRIDDDWLWQPMVLPGESLVGANSVWSVDGAATCEIRDVSVYEVDDVPALAPDAATCEINDGDIDVVLDTSTVESDVEIDVYVALLDSEGQRVDYGLAYFYDIADAASPMKETAYSPVDVVGVTDCQVRFISGY